MNSSLVRKNITLGDRRTSLRLEREFWNALDDLCRREQLTVQTVCTAIEAHRTSASRTSAVRSFIMAYFRHATHPQGDMDPALARMLSTARRENVGKHH